MENKLCNVLRWMIENINHIGRRKLIHLQGGKNKSNNPQAKIGRLLLCDKVSTSFMWFTPQ